MKSSSYGSAAPFKPSWAKKSALAVVASTQSVRLTPLADTELYHAAVEEGGEWGSTDQDFFTAPPPLSRPNAAPPAASKAHVPCGGVSASRYSHTGDVLAVASHDGSLFSMPVHVGRCAARGGRQLLAVRARTKAGAVASHDTGTSASLRTKSPLTCLSLSYHAWSGLDVRLRQAGGGGSGGGSGRSKGAVDRTRACRVILGCGGGEERSAWVWAGCAPRSAPLLQLSNETLVTGGGRGAAGTPLPGPVTGCALYYLDRFAVLSSGDRVSVCGFSLSSRDATADAAGEGESRAWVASSWPVAPGLEGGTTVTHVACHNTFRSPLLFTACADRSVRVFDVGAGAGASEALRIPGAHARAIHSLSLADGSSYAAVPPSGLDCFLTAGTDALPGGGGGGGGSAGLVRLWDMRSATCARQFAGGHSNSRHACGAALSPDGLYVACGSEDRAVVVYDTRMETVLVKLRGATDTVTTVAWHPRTLHLLAGSLDGGVRTYGPPVTWTGAPDAGGGGGGDEGQGEDEED